MPVDHLQNPGPERAPNTFGFDQKQGPQLAQEQSCTILKQYFDYLEQSLFNQDQPVDTDQLQTLLVEISLFLQSDRTEILSDGYNQLLNRLTHIYSHGLKYPDNQAYSATAAKYAGVLGVVSQAHSTYDYSEAFGLLLYYMNQLFRKRKSNWIEIYEQLLSLSDASQVSRTLIRPHLEEIQQWVEEGVANLFQLREDQLQQIEEMEHQQTSVVAHIEQTQHEITSQSELFGESNVVRITRPLKQQEIEKQLLERRDLADELEVKWRVVDLLDENIHEFEEKLSQTRLKYLIHPV